MFKTDAHGLAFSCSDIKISGGSHTWAMKISQLPKQAGAVRILTYSLPDMDYVREQLGRRPTGISLVAHEKFRGRAQEIRNEFPQIRVAVHPEMHSKVLLIEPQTVWLGSANFGCSHWHESNVGIHSVAAHDYYAAVFDRLWTECVELLPANGGTSEFTKGLLGNV